MNGRDQPSETARHPIRWRNFPRSLGVFKRRTSRDRVRLQSQPILRLSDGAQRSDHPRHDGYFAECQDKCPTP
jgi:hypothetical protein